MKAIPRRAFAVGALSSVAVVGIAKEAAAAERIVAERLLGKWQSDVDKSMEFNNAFVKLTDKQRHFLQHFLGKLTVEFDESKRVMTMPTFKFKMLDDKVIEEEGWRAEDEYQVLAKTTESVAIKSSLFGNEEIALINFDGERIWMYDETMHHREYFKRVK